MIFLIPYDAKNGARIQINEKSHSYYFLKFMNEANAKDFILVNIKDAISLRASKQVIEGWKSEYYKDSWTKKTIEINLSSTSISLLKNSPCLYHPLSNFSPLFHSFALTLSRMYIAPLSKDTNHIFEYVFEGKKYYILNGVYINPHSQNIVQ